MALTTGTPILKRFVREDLVDFRGAELPQPAITLGKIVVDGLPIAVDDAAATMEDTPLDIEVLFNDSDPGNQPLTVVNVSTPMNGSASTDGTRVTYTPNPNYYGSDSFIYAIQDSSLNTVSATVNITVTALSDPPLGTNRFCEPQ